MKVANPCDQIRQGDVLLVPVNEIPAEAEIRHDQGIKIEGERTGHAHQLVGRVATAGNRTFVRGGNVLTHEEHEHVVTSPTWYEVRVQREFVSKSTSMRRRD